MAVQHTATGGSKTATKRDNTTPTTNVSLTLCSKNIRHTTLYIHNDDTKPKLLDPKWKSENRFSTLLNYTTHWLKL